MSPLAETLQRSVIERLEQRIRYLERELEVSRELAERWCRKALDLMNIIDHFGRQVAEVR